MRQNKQKKPSLPYATAMPYMFSDTPEIVEMLAVDWIIDQVIDWFGNDIRIEKSDKERLYKITLKLSPTAMLFWAMKYTNECFEAEGTYESA